MVPTISASVTTRRGCDMQAVIPLRKDATPCKLWTPGTIAGNDMLRSSKSLGRAIARK